MCKTLVNLPYCDIQYNIIIAIIIFVSILSVYRYASSIPTTEYSWLCSEHFVTDKKSNNPLAPNFIPTIFKHIGSLQKRKLNAMEVSFDRRQTMKRKRGVNHHMIGMKRVFMEDLLVFLQLY